MSHLPLDARAILHYLNELGYRNISATQLKEFLKDLRKLIKYEERMGIHNQQNDYYESLFRRTTASYRAKIDRENDPGATSTKRKSFDSEKSSKSRQSAAENRKILGNRNHGVASTSSYDLLESSYRSPNQTRSPPLKSRTEKNYEELKSDTKSIKALIEYTLTQILREKYSQEFVGSKDIHNMSKEKTPVKSVIEQVIKEKLSDLRHHKSEELNFSGPGSLKSIIEDVVAQVLQEKLSGLEEKSGKSENNDGLKNLNRDLQQKLNVSKEPKVNLLREPVTHYNTNKSLDSQTLVEQLLASKEVNKKPVEKKNAKKSKSDKDFTADSTAGHVKRLQRSPKKNPEWQDPRPNEIILDKPQKSQRTRSPAASSSARSGRSKYSSSVLIRRSLSQGRHNKPNSDPVALYQYYKNEWEHFRKQIPGETSHNRLRWCVRQRFLDPE